MSSVSKDVPTFEINNNELQNLVCFVYHHERLLKEFGALKIRLNNDCKLSLKKRRKSAESIPVTTTIIKKVNRGSAYFVEKTEDIDRYFQQESLITDEQAFWSMLSGCEAYKCQFSSSSTMSLFCQRTSRRSFDIHDLPARSVLKLGGPQVTRNITPCLKRAYGSGTIFPLSSTPHRLFSLNYHHEGGIHHWYIIPSSQREALQQLFHQENTSICLDHGHVLIDPSMLEINQIRYHHIAQNPREFVVLSGDALSQTFTEQANWTESITFALPSWIAENRGSESTHMCQCNIHDDFISTAIHMTHFRQALIQRYIDRHLNITTCENKRITVEGWCFNR